MNRSLNRRKRLQSKRWSSDDTHGSCTTQGPRPNTGTDRTLEEAQLDFKSTTPARQHHPRLRGETRPKGRCRRRTNPGERSPSGQPRRPSRSHWVRIYSFLIRCSSGEQADLIDAAPGRDEDKDPGKEQVSRANAGSGAQGARVLGVRRRPPAQVATPGAGSRRDGAPCSAGVRPHPGLGVSNTRSGSSGRREAERPARGEAGDAPSRGPTEASAPQSSPRTQPGTAAGPPRALPPAPGAAQGPPPGSGEGPRRQAAPAVRTASRPPRSAGQRGPEPGRPRPRAPSPAALRRAGPAPRPGKRASSRWKDACRRRHQPHGRSAYLAPRRRPQHRGSAEALPSRGRYRDALRRGRGPEGRALRKEAGERPLPSSLPARRRPPQGLARRAPPGPD